MVTIFAVREGIEAAQYNAHDILVAMHAHSTDLNADLNARLNELYDICDYVADAIDHLGTHPGATDLESEYESMLQYVNTLQEKVDLIPD